MSWGCSLLQLILILYNRHVFNSCCYKHFPLIKLIEWKEAFITNHLLYVEKHKLPSFKKQKTKLIFFIFFLNGQQGLSKNGTEHI